MNNRLNRINNLLENLYPVLQENSKITLPAKQVPAEIQKYAENVLGKKPKEYKLYQNTKVNISLPWHEADRVEYSSFKLLDNGKMEKEDSKIVRSGLEGAGTYQKNYENIEVPEGYVLVSIGTYPPRVEIYAGAGALQLINNKPSDEELSDIELFILQFTRSLTSAGRKEYNEKIKNIEELKSGLASKGYLTKSGAITLKGKNALDAFSRGELLDKLKPIARDLDVPNVG